MIDETPVSVLKDRIKYYETFISRIQTGEGLAKNQPEGKIELMVVQVRTKIKEFELAIDVLNK